MSVSAHQLLIVQPTLMALVYASNSKLGCFNGFTQVRSMDINFNYFEFLAAKALPGPGSITTCILQPYGPVGETRYLML